MPTEFRIGLIATVLVLGAVRMRKSLRIVRRSVAQGEHTRFSWSRWYHLSIAWALVFFCLPFAVGVAFPDTAHEVSLSVDRYLAGENGDDYLPDPGPERARRVSFSQTQLMKLEISHRDRTRDADDAYAARRRAHDEDALSGWGTLAVSGGVLAVLLVLASFLARVRRAGAMLATSFAGLVASIGALTLSAPVATKISGVLDESRTVSDYAAADVVGAAQAAWLAGPAQIVGRPTRVSGATPGFLYHFTPSEGAAPPVAPWGGFELGTLTVGPAERGQLHIMKPSVRLTTTGKEILVRDTEDVVVMGFVADGAVLPRDGYPIVVAPASARGSVRRLCQILFGAPRRRDLYTAMLQVACTAFAAWFLSLLLGALTERIAARLAASRAADAIANDTHPSITQLLRYGER